jgi:hypothetical protein
LFNEDSFNVSLFDDSLGSLANNLEDMASFINFFYKMGFGIVETTQPTNDTVSAAPSDTYSLEEEDHYDDPSQFGKSHVVCVKKHLITDKI